GPAASVSQRVNWVAVHDDRKREGLPDAGGYPVLQPQRSGQPLRVVRDLAFRVRLQGKDVPAKAGRVEGAWPNGAAAAELPAGSYAARDVEAKLPAADWLKAAKDAGAPGGPVLPDFATVTIRYEGKTGSVEVERAQLLAAGPESPNLLPNGGFE